MCMRESVCVCVCACAFACACTCEFILSPQNTRLPKTHIKSCLTDYVRFTIGTKLIVTPNNNKAEKDELWMYA